MKTGKINIDEQRMVLAATRNTEHWVKADKVAEMLGMEKESLMNNIREHQYPELIVRQSLLTKVWWVWLPAVIGFKPEEWAA